LYCDFLASDSIGNKKVPDVDMTCSFTAAGSFLIVGELDGALVVLVQDGSGAVALRF
jgi:hypothetical protein